MASRIVEHSLQYRGFKPWDEAYLDNSRSKGGLKVDPVRIRVDGPALCEWRDEDVLCHVGERKHGRCLKGVEAPLILLLCPATPEDVFAECDDDLRDIRNCDPCRT